MILPVRSPRDPTLDQRGLFGWQRRTVFRLRHHLVGIATADTPQHFRGLWIPGDERMISRLALRHRPLARNIGNPARLLHSAVTGGAVLCQQGPDVPPEIHRLRTHSGGGKAHWRN